MHAVCRASVLRSLLANHKPSRVSDSSGLPIATYIHPGPCFLDSIKKRSRGIEQELSPLAGSASVQVRPHMHPGDRVFLPYAGAMRRTHSSQVVRSRLLAPALKCRFGFAWV